MSNKDVYEELAEMIDGEATEHTGVPMSPECMRIIRLLYTPSEARLALQVGVSGGTLGQLSQKTGIEKAKLKETLHAMANKSTIFYDPAEEDPTYMVVGGVRSPGWVDACLWGGIRFPYSVHMAKELDMVLRDFHPRRLANLGLITTSIWAATAALPKDASPSEDIAQVIKGRGSWSVSTCPCRLSHWIATPGEHCSHMLEVCMLTGEIARWAVKHGMARELTYDQAVELLQKTEQDGLVHDGDPERWDVLCNCCKDCCAVLVGEAKSGTQLAYRSPFMPQVNEETCNACGACVEPCPAGAIGVDQVASVNTETCLGCGVCILKCDVDALTLVRRPVAEQPQAAA